MNNGRDRDRLPAGQAGWEAETGRETTSLVRLFGQMMMLPLTVFVYGMDLFIKTVQGVQRTTDEGMDVMMGGAARPYHGAGASAPPPHEEYAAVTPTPGEEQDVHSECASSPSISSTGVDADDANTNPKEKMKMTDRDLSDDKQLKLVRYKVLFIKRDYEHAFPEVEELVSDSMDETAYTAWKIAEFIQRLAERKTKVPSRWKKFPPEDKRYRDGNILLGFPEHDKKYLRVYFEVLDRYDRESFKFEERQIEVLEEIRDRISS